MMIRFYKFIAREEMACDEAELGADEFAERMQIQEKIQEQQLEMLKHIRKFPLDDQSAILEKVKAVELAGCDWIHVDVMDGRFVPNITIGPLVVDALRPVTDLPLDVHLMIVEPDQRVPDFIKAGADIVSVHCEQSSTIHLHRAVNQIKSLGAKAGVVLNPGTPLSAIEYVLDELEHGD